MMKTTLRQLALTRQLLSTQQNIATGLAGTLQTIQQLGYVQIDTISVVERAHHHVLWNRVPGYEHGHLNQLVQQKKIFEYWFHAAAYLPVEDYRFALPQMLEVRKGTTRYFGRGDAGLMREILAKIQAEGKISSRQIDAKHKNKQGTWWNSGPARRAFEHLFMQGDLMICERQGMEKFYDLSERCLPEGLNLNMPSMDEYAEYLFKTVQRAHGVFSWKQLIHLKSGQPIRDAMRQLIHEKLSTGEIQEIQLDRGQKLYVDGVGMEQMAERRNSSSQQGEYTDVKILSPFDNLIIHRERLNTLFDFDYKMECYVPAEKRIFGYFSLPVLAENELVGRMDCKAHRAEKRLEVISLHLQTEIRQHDVFWTQLAEALTKFAVFNQCAQVDVQHIAGLAQHLYRS